jgi:hypothetical protein
MYPSATAPPAQLAGVITGVVIPVIGIVIALLAWLFPNQRKEAAAYVKSPFVHHVYHSGEPQGAGSQNPQEVMTMGML